MQRPSSWKWPRAALAALLLVGACNAFAISEEKLPARVQVTWAPADALSEVKDNPMRRGWLRPEDWQRSLSEYVRIRADRLLPQGQKLDVTIDDIKLAGSFEPWHGPRLDDVRILKDIYPPRAELHYRLLDADGSVVREGSGKLRDFSYLQRSVADSTDALRYDKRMLGEWLTREFGPARK